LVPAVDGKNLLMELGTCFEMEATDKWAAQTGPFPDDCSGVPGAPPSTAGDRFSKTDKRGTFQVQRRCLDHLSVR
jgi:hypothetical protein